MLLYRFFLIFDALFMKLPRSWRKHFFLFLASLVHTVAFQRNRVIQQNIAFAFNASLSPQEKKEIEGYCYRNLALNLLQTMENRRNSAEELAQQVSFKNRAKVDEYLAKGQNIIFVSAHFGNWELGGAALSSLITPVTSIYKGFSNAAFDPYLLEARTRHRMTLSEKKGALKQMAKALKNNDSILLMIDQASKAKYGVLTHFFAHDTYQSSTAAYLSAKFHAPIIGVYITTEDEEHYTLTFDDPIDTENSDEATIVEATAKQTENLERQIRNAPKFWFWCHKKWKTTHNEIYE